MPPIIATLHPSAVLRAQTDEDRHSQMQSLVADLREAARIAEKPSKAYCLEFDFSRRSASTLR